MSILTELKKLTKKKNATVVSQALPDSLDGSGSGGGANVLTLYITMRDDEYWAFKDSGFTEGFESFEEARNAAFSADIIKFFYAPTVYAYPVSVTIVDQMPIRSYVVAAITEESSNGPQLKPVYLYKYNSGPQ